MDLSTEAIDYARGLATARGLSNIEFVTRDLSDFDTWAERDSFDFITTFDVVHDQAQPLRSCKGFSVHEVYAGRLESAGTRSEHFCTPSRVCTA